MRWERLEPDRLAVDPWIPRSREIGTAGCEQQQRAGDVTGDALEQLEEWPFRPVDVLDQDDHGLLGRELGQKADPRRVQPVACSQRMEIACDVESEREAEDLARAEPPAELLRRIAFENREVLLQYFA